MASRRTRTATRPVSKITVEALSDKDDIAEEKTKQKQVSTSDTRRKISMLGPVWNEEELKLFYQAYRKHGKNWKKVAASMHKRTQDMVEALYTVNKAYLSLPDGAASAEGLIAMMTDHYNILDESRSDGVESSAEFGGSDLQNQSRLRTRGRGVSGTVTGSLQAAATYGGPSPAKKPRTSRGRAVGKRTPRFPVGNHLDKQSADNIYLVPQQGIDCETDEDGDDSRVAEVVALTLATASQRAASPQVSRTPNTRTPRKHIKVVPFQNGDVRESLLRTESGGSAPRQTFSTSGEGGNVESQISKELDNGYVAKGSSSIDVGDSTPSGTRARKAQDSRNGSRKPVAKRLKVQRIEDLDEKEECSRTEGKMFHDEENGDVLDMEETKLTQSQRKKRASTQRAKKRSRQLFAGDESSGLDRLATLADLSLQSLNGLLPSPTLESGEGMSEKQQTVSRDAHVKDDALPHLIRSDFVGREVDEKIKVQELSRDSSGREQHQLISPPDSRKRKRKGASEKAEDAGKLGAAEVVKEEVLLLQNDTPIVLKPRYKARRAPNNRAMGRQPSRAGKQIVVLGSEYNAGIEHSVDDGALSSRSRNKKKGLADKTTGCEDKGAPLGHPMREEAHCPHTTSELGPLSTKARLTHCLSTKFRRWCMCEWFYSAIDLPWFARNEFVEYLNHAGLGHVPKLTRVEWGVIRSSLGKPRRLSKKFLEEERDKLEKYREKARVHYHELRSGLRDGLPPDLARPLTVGQRVIARHPRTRQIHDGSILTVVTVDRSRCRVQFDRPELGVELVMDIDCMPVHPLENMPEVMRRRRIIVDGVDRNLEDARADYKSKIYVTAGGAARAALNERLERPSLLPSFAPPSHMSFQTLSKRAQADTVDSVALAKAAANEAAAAVQQAVLCQSHTAAQLQAKEADVQALADLTRVLDKKEALLVELKRTADDAAGKDGKLCEPSNIKMHCAAIVLQLTEANKQVHAALQHLRRRNKYQDNIVAPWAQALQQAAITAKGSGLEPLSETGPSVEDIAASAKKHARFMITTTIQAMSLVKEGEDTLSKLGGALDFAPEEAQKSDLLQSEPTAAAAAAADGSDIASKLSLAVPVGQDAGEAVVAPSGVASEPTAPEAVSKSGGEIPGHLGSGGSLDGAKDTKAQLSELMASCVATLLLVQATAERQLPPSEVAVALDKSLMGLRPRAAQNHHIFREIERIVSVIKGQIASQVPMQATLTPVTDASNRIQH